MHFHDPLNPEGLEIVGWTPAIQPKHKNLAPWEALAFEAGANEAATSPLNQTPEPTQAQKSAGRYAKGRVSFQGLKLAIENPRGSVRSGPGWSVTMPHHYGYIKRTQGADGEGVDAFVGRDLDSDIVTVIDQVNPDTGAFDEHKVMLGFPSEQAAREAYQASYTPGWEGLGGAKVCTMADFKAWLADGDLRRPVAKAGFAEPSGDGTRWITVHPNGKDEPGHPVQIRPVSGHPGVFHVVGGADGKLNGLRLQGIKDPATYREESKARVKAHRIEKDRKQAEALGKLTPEEKAERVQNEGGARERVKKAEESLIRATLEAQGIDADQAMNLPGVDPEEDKLAYTKHRQELLSHAQRAANDAQRRITLDADARTRAGLDTVGGDNHPSADEVLSLTEDERGPGYQRNLREKAKEAGLTPQDLAKQVEDLKVKAAEARVADGDFSDRHVELGEGDPVKGILMAGAIMGEMNRTAHMKAKALKAASDGATKEALKAAVTNNEQAAKILEARKELREAKRALKKGKANLFEGGYQAKIEDLDDAVLQDAHNALRTERMVGFLNEVEEAHGEDDLDLGKPHVEDGLHASRGAGAFDAVHEIALASMGQGAMNRDTAEVLGPDGAGIVLARALRSAYTPEEQLEILKAIEEVHQEEQDTDLPRVMAEVNQLRADAMATGQDLSETPRDLSTAAEMQKNRVAMLREARHQLGGLLGRMEARAAFIMAMKEAPKEVLSIPLGSLGKDQAVLTAAALGLKAGDYDLDYEKGEGVLTLKGQGQDRLIRPFDQAAASERDLAIALKRGAFDEDGWIPNGFARRAELTSDDPIQDPPLFRQAFNPKNAQTREDLQGVVEDYIGARYADGDRVTDILLGLNNLEAADSVPEHLREDFADLVRNIIPLRENVTDAEGNAIQDEAGDEGGESPRKYLGLRTKAVTAETMDRAAEQIAEDYFNRKGLDEGGAFYAQRANENGPDFAEGIHQALAKDPKLQAGFIPPAMLTNDQQGQIRDYFYENLLGQSAKAKDRDKGALESAQRAAGPEPDKDELDMFGEVSTSPGWLEWHERVQAAMGQADAGDEKDPASPWAQFVTTMGGVKNAQKAIQDHMKGAFLGHFADHYERATGRAFKRGQSEIHQAPMFLKSVGTPEERAQAAAERQAETMGLRKRASGKFADMGGEGAVALKREENRQRGGAAAAEAGSMFDLEEFSDGPAEDPAAPAKEAFKLKLGHRLSLGYTLDAQLYKAMPNALKAMHGQERGVSLRPVSMSGRYEAQQRGVKAITHLKRVGLFYGAGSGKTPIMLGAHAELAKSGKVKKAIYAVPSAVQAQFGAEAATFLDPKSGLYIHANPGETFAERLKAYQDPEIHGVVVTHQSLRDDTLKVLGQARGIEDHDTLVAWVKQAPREELAKAVKDAWTKSGVDYQALFLDEGHNALNRAGKEDSTLSKIVDAIGDTAPYYAAATADPIKNDACLHPDTPIHDPVRNITKSVRAWADDNERPWVWALNVKTGIPTLVQASVPWVKSKDRPMFRVKAAQDEIVVAADHKFLTPRGWVHLSDLHVGDLIASVPQPSRPQLSCPTPGSLHGLGADDQTPPHADLVRTAADSSLSLKSSPSSHLRHSFLDGRPQSSPASLGFENVRDALSVGPKGAAFDPQEMAGSGGGPKCGEHSTQSIPNFQGGCRTCRRFGDGRPHGIQGISQCTSPSPADAPQHNHENQPLDGLEPEHGCRPQQSCHPSKNDARPQYLCQDAIPASCNKGCLPGCNTGEHLPVSNRESDRTWFGGSNSEPPTPAIDCPTERIYSASEHLFIEYVQIAEINQEGCDDIYDLTVPVLHNYYSCGLWHHNTEAYDWLTKMDPKRYPAKGRDEWMARYGKNTSLMRRSMKAELARYYFTARVAPTVNGHEIQAHRGVVSAPVLPHQKEALAAVDRAIAGVRFAKTPEELAAHAAVIAPGTDPSLVKKAIGTMKEAAYNRILNMDPKGGKVLKTVELAKQSVAEGKPAIVFARNLDAVEAIRAAMEEAGIPVTTLTGDDTSEAKATKKAAFQGPKPTAQVIVMSDAGATGLNMQRAKTVIHHDIPVTHMIHSQRLARAWRLGQTEDVTEHTVAADHSFDHQNLRRLKHKETLAGIYKSAEGGLDDTGTAERLRAIRERRNQAQEPEPFAA